MKKHLKLDQRRINHHDMPEGVREIWCAQGVARRLASDEERSTLQEHRPQKFDRLWFFRRQFG